MYDDDDGVEVVSRGGGVAGHGSSFSQHSRSNRNPEKKDLSPDLEPLASTPSFFSTFLVSS